MTDAAHPGRVIRAGIPSVLEPIRGLSSGLEVPSWRRALTEGAAILVPIVMVLMSLV